MKKIVSLKKRGKESSSTLQPSKKPGRFRLAAAASAAGGPEAEGVATPAPDVDGTLQVGAWVARSGTTAAVIPVDSVHLPHADIVAAVP